MAHNDSKLLNVIPSVDLSDFVNKGPEKKASFSKKIGDAFSTIGFVAVKNHYLTDELTNQLYNSFESFFNLSDEIKNEYARPNLFGQRGYVGKKGESAKGSDLGDLKEFFHIGQILDSLDLKALGYPENVWPKEVLGLKDVCTKVYAALEQTGLELLRAIALYLGLEENYFDDKVTGGNSILRAIHYYPLQVDDVKEGGVRAAAHGDINLITLLMGASAEGLEVQRRDNKWIKIIALPDQIICNVGDMLERLTNTVLKSTIHRVVNPPKEKLNQSRYSMPFFMHPRRTMDLTVLDNCISDEKPKQFSDISAGLFLEERLKELGLIKD